MPTPLIQSYAKRAKKTVQQVEAIWDKAKEQAKGIRRSEAIDKQYWALVNGLVKKELGLCESLTFKSFITENLYKAMCPKCKRKIEYNSTVDNRYSTPMCCNVPTKPLEDVNEGFVSNLTNLSTKELEGIFNKDFSMKIKFLYSAFIELKKGSDAVYKFVSLDKEAEKDEQYLVNTMTVAHYLDKGYKLLDHGGMPDGQFKTLELAKRFIDS